MRIFVVKTWEILYEDENVKHKKRNKLLAKHFGLIKRNISEFKMKN